MKNIILISFYINFLFCVLTASAQSNAQDYLKLEKERISKADSVENEIKHFISKNIYSFKISPIIVKNINNSLKNEHDALDVPLTNNDINKVLLQIKSDKLRNLYLSNNPKVLPYFSANNVSKDLMINCINGGFETGNVSNYSFRSLLASANPIQHFEEGCSVINNSGVFLPSVSFNQYQDRATLVTNGNEPFLSEIGVNINQTHSGDYSLKINPNPIDAPTLQIGNITSVYRDFQIDDDAINFSYLHFGYVVPEFSHIQPFFRYRLYSINSSGNTTGILREICIPMDFMNCQYQHVPDNRLGTNTLAYTPDWVCQQINTSDLIGQNVRLEFTVSDCEYRGHFSTVYIDDLCGTTCPPTWGAIQLDNININCPTEPFNVCGNFQLPNQSTIGTLSLNVLNQFGNTIATLSNAIINGQNFCFSVSPTVFGSNPSGSYTFQVVANLNNSTCVTTLVDLLGRVTYASSTITPTFNQIPPICSGDSMPLLPLTSLNGIIGSWNPAVNNTVTTTYTFVPSQGSCGNTAQMTVVVNPRITPYFNQVEQVCQDSFLEDLPTISNNAIIGTWSPVINNSVTTTYTFSPTTGICIEPVYMTIVIIPKTTPIFSDINSICYADNSFSLPLVSENNVYGTWSPILNTTVSAIYNFTPNLDECAFSKEIQLEVYDDFNFLNEGYCQDNNYYMKVTPLSESYNPDTANYEWQINNITVSSNSIFNISAYLKSAIEIENVPFDLTIKVTNSNGCFKIRTITIDNIFCGIQQGISVNNDNLNDFFDLRLLDVKQLKIFNRYGMLVYDKYNYHDEWIGQSNGREDLPAGTYYYVIEFNNLDYPAKVGWIYVLREVK